MAAVLAAVSKQHCRYFPSAACGNSTYLQAGKILGAGCLRRASSCHGKFRETPASFTPPPSSSSLPQVDSGSRVSKLCLRIPTSARLSATTKWTIFFRRSNQLPCRAKRSHRRDRPEFAKQEIISVPPPAADNSTQTIVNPPHPEILHRDVPLPNIVVSTPTPAPPTLALSKSQITFPAGLRSRLCSRRRASRMKRAR